LGSETRRTEGKRQDSVYNGLKSVDPDTISMAMTASAYDTELVEGEGADTPTPILAVPVMIPWEVTATGWSKTRQESRYQVQTPRPQVPH
jgi:hypothetical protein